MADPIRPDTTEGYRTPRWVKVFGLVLAVLVLLIALMLLVGGPGGHGPQRHFG